MADNTTFTQSSGNVFDDLGFGEESKYLLAKARLMEGLEYFVKANGWTQKEAAAAFGVHQPTVSNLVNGKLSSFTLDRLVKMAEHAGLGINVELVGLEYA